MVGLGATAGGSLLFSGQLSAAENSQELSKEETPLKSISNYNNFYEFSTDKESVAPLSQGFRSSPWTVKVGGLVEKPATFDIDDIRKNFPQEERIYRLRCVEAWSMVIPWVGFPLASLLKVVQPLSKAKYVRFETLYDTKQMPGQKSSWYKWPYVEGLRLDEAMNDLAILATGLMESPCFPKWLRFVWSCPGNMASKYQIHSED
jgi:sulfoxide reductase catalytic subunit YedY